MEEYIKREDLLKEDFIYKCINVDDATTIEKLIKSVPAADVVEVVNSRWLYVSERSDRIDYECENCRGHILTIKEPDYILAYRYCPNCSANMIYRKESNSLDTLFDEADVGTCSNKVCSDIGLVNIS